MKTSDNLSIKDKEIIRCNLVCFFLDIRNSTTLNDKLDKRKLFEIYSSILDEIFEILKNNGFKNVEIQGDGIYGIYVFENEKSKLNQIIKTIKEVETVMDEVNNKYNVQSTISIRFGTEFYGVFGGKENNNKRISFFGNVVSKTKKMNSMAIQGKVVIAKSKFNKENWSLFKEKFSFDYEDEIYLKNGSNIGPVYLKKWK